MTLPVFLPNDVSRCYGWMPGYDDSGYRCPIAHTCKRFLAEMNERTPVTTGAWDGEKCGMRIEVNK